MHNLNSLKRLAAPTVDQDLGAMKRAKVEVPTAPEFPNGECRKVVLILQKKRNRLQRSITTRSKPIREVSTTISSKKKNKRAERKSVGHAVLSAVPLDILFEISLNVSPADLLILSRVSRALRDFYLSKSNRQIWVISLASMGLPLCPEDLSEPQYASLIFDNDCIACDSPRVKSLNYIHRLRMCKQCHELNVVGHDIIVNEFVAYELQGDIPTGFDVVKKAACDYVPSVDDTKRKRNSRNSGNLQCYRPDLHDALIECLQQYRIKSAVEFQAFVDGKIRLRDSIYEHANKLQKWMNATEERRKLELANVAQKHEESVKSKLRELGYTDADWNHIVYEDNLKAWKALVHRERELTELTWKNMRPKLESILTDSRMQYNKDKRSEEFTMAYYYYHRDLNLTAGERYFMPRDDEMTTLEVVQKFIFANDARRPITQALWDSFLPVVQKICSLRKIYILCNHVRALSRSRGEGAGVLDNPLQHIVLASTFFSSPFRSSDTRRLYYFNSIHSIGTYTPHSGRVSPKIEAYFHYLFRNCEVINLGIPDALLISFGFALTTPMSLMQGFGERFVCCRCTNLRPRKLMGWSALVMHYIDKLEKENINMQIFPYLVNYMPFTEDHTLEGGDFARILTDSQIVSALNMNAIVADRSFA